MASACRMVTTSMEWTVIELSQRDVCKQVEVAEEPPIIIKKGHPMGWPFLIVENISYSVVAGATILYPNCLSASASL